MRKTQVCGGIGFVDQVRLELLQPPRRLGQRLARQRVGELHHGIRRGLPAQALALGFHGRAHRVLDVGAKQRGNLVRQETDLR